MADRTSAEIFGIIFEKLASKPTEDNKELAKELFEKCSDYDFSYSQMEIDDSLIILGLAKIGIDERYPEDGECIVYN
ncbi:hypothetical protein [Chryseobacterium aureum]|uniref:hypothetical protein n=1 Tax=Chryseobacterium aureum TaxID=2497456 RepID=UPI000F88267C|nr:hypothetical protein [Chryseobacterium aureum]